MLGDFLAEVTIISFPSIYCSTMFRVFNIIKIPVPILRNSTNRKSVFEEMSWVGFLETSGIICFYFLAIAGDLVKLACPPQIKIGQCYWYKNKPLKDNRNKVFRDIHHWLMYRMKLWFKKMRKWHQCKTKTISTEELETRVVYQNNYLVNILTENNTWHRLSCNWPSVLTIYMTLKINCTMR